MYIKRTIPSLAIVLDINLCRYPIQIESSVMLD